jgi:hypothetical protein
VKVITKFNIDDHHRRLIYWDLHGKEGLASRDEVRGWLFSKTDHALQNTSDLKAEEEMRSDGD